MYKLHLGDSLNVLQQYPDNYFDSVVTDPPAGISFMNSRWDSDKGGRDSWIAWMTNIMQEVNRVLKPGGHILVWALPRTSHWTATAIEDAGFQVRDIIHHAFSQGFPKSRNISKDIDRKLGAESKVVEVRRFGGRSGDTPTAGASNGGVQGGFNYKDVRDITAPATLEAQQWDGWGTCLKPAVENWILARKPISEKTIAENVLKWGTGAINIDGCRIATNEVIANHSRSAKSAKSKGIYGDSKGQETHQTRGQKLGRFPANVILDEEAGALLDEQSGITRSGKVKSDKGAYAGISTTGFLRGITTTQNQHGDSGGASRFFYCAKASKKERGEGNNHPTVKPVKLMEYLITLITPPNGIVLDPFMGSGTTLLAAEYEGFDSVGIEIDESYYRIAEARLANKEALNA